jgi:hypothetical protein
MELVNVVVINKKQLEDLFGKWKVLFKYFIK